TGNESAIAALIRILDTTDHDSTRWQAADSLGKIGTGNESAIAALIRILDTTDDESTRRQAAYSLGKIGTGNERAIAALIRILDTTDDESTRRQAADSLKEILQDHQLWLVIPALKDYLTDQVYENNFNLYEHSYELIWHCAQTLPYPEFYQAWHHSPLTPHPEVPKTTGVGFTPESQRLNNAELPSLLRAAINSNSELKDKVRLIGIDGNNFIDTDNPAIEIYCQMLDQNCPERQNGEPETMPKLMFYWHSLQRNLKKESNSTPVLVFYNSRPSPSVSVSEGTEEEERFSDTFLKALSKFNGAICVVTEQPDIPLQSFSPSQPNLVEDIVAWICGTIWES
ncbi:MAG TPA: PBS lyase, partial [Cyanobacteria bacterium UBA8803]|nr:PBS lyase [Cyanobacteria bacterium UBA8803]